MIYPSFLPSTEHFGKNNRKNEIGPVESKYLQKSMKYKPFCEVNETSKEDEIQTLLQALSSMTPNFLETCQSAIRKLGKLRKPGWMSETKTWDA